MKANTSFLLRKGYLCGIGSGMTWGLDTVLIGVVMLAAPFVNNPILLIGGTIICSMLHDVFAAFWMLIIMGFKGELKNLKSAIITKDGFFCILGALFGGPLAMTFYIMAISEGGPALTATITSCYPLLGSALAIIVLKEKMNLRSWIGLLICVFGIIFIGYSPFGNDTINLGKGITFAVIAAIGWATEAVVCGYGMKAGKVNPQMALLIREITSGIVYLLIVVPLILGGFDKMAMGTKAIFEYFPAWSILLVTALIGMSSFLMWYNSIDLIGAAKALCLNITYSLWAVIFTFIFMKSALTINIVIGALMIVGGVILATLIVKKK